MSNILLVRENYITLDQEKEILEHLKDVEFDTVTENGLSVQYKVYGNKFENGAKKVAKIPAYISNIIDKLVKNKLIVKRPDQVLINRFKRGDYVLPSIDSSKAGYDSKILSISLGDPVSILFFKIDKSRYVEKLKSLTNRSLLVLSGEYRDQWFHAVPETGNRYTITFRYVVDDHKKGFLDIKDVTNPLIDPYSSPLPQPAAAALVKVLDSVSTLIMNYKGDVLLLTLNEIRAKLGWNPFIFKVFRKDLRSTAIIAINLRSKLNTLIRSNPDISEKELKSFLKNNLTQVEYNHFVKYIHLMKQGEGKKINLKVEKKGQHVFVTGDVREYIDELKALGGTIPKRKDKKTGTMKELSDTVRFPIESYIDVKNFVRTVRGETLEFKEWRKNKIKNLLESTLIFQRIVNEELSIPLVNRVVNGVYRCNIREGLADVSKRDFNTIKKVITTIPEYVRPDIPGEVQQRLSFVVDSLEKRLPDVNLKKLQESMTKLTVTEEDVARGIARIVNVSNVFTTESVMNAAYMIAYEKDRSKLLNTVKDYKMAYLTPQDFYSAVKKPSLKENVTRFTSFFKHSLNDDAVFVLLISVYVLIRFSALGESRKLKIAFFA